MTLPTMRIVVRSVNDSVLQDNIVRMSRATGRTVKEETRTVFKGMVRDAIIYTPPAGGKATGKDAQRQGEFAIVRDLKLMGFAPRPLKGHRTITKAWGRPITPVSVPTKENPKFAAPDAFHLQRLLAKTRGGKPSRGRAQAYYVSSAKLLAMVKRLYAQVGEMASGWVKAAVQLGVPVPAWIARHSGARGTEVQIIETEQKITMRVVNHFPENAVAEAAEMRRRIDTLKRYAIGRLKRQLPFLLRKSARAAKRN